MHHYPFNIGDYKKDTAHLSLLEHGIYRMLIDSYYANEGPLEADDAKLMRTHCIRSADEQQAYKNVIEDFFQERDGMYYHSGCEKVLEKIFAKSAKARESAEARWAKKNKRLKGKECERNANAMRTPCEHNADGMLPNTHNPKPNTHSDPGGKPPVCPVSKIVEVYNQTQNHLPRVRVVSKDTERKISARWKENEKFQKLEFWKTLFTYCEENHFLSGRSPPRPGNEAPFRASLDWIVSPRNFAKIINQNYERTQNTTP